jgi:hypothetical protein
MKGNRPIRVVALTGNKKAGDALPAKDADGDRLRERTHQQSRYGWVDALKRGKTEPVYGAARRPGARNIEKSLPLSLRERHRLPVGGN